MPVEILNTSAEVLNQLPKNQTVFFLGVGPIEDHGPHLPMGLDGIEAQEYSRLASQWLEDTHPQWKGVIMPWVPLSVDSNTTRYALRVRPHVLRDYLVDICLGLIQMGFRHFVFFSGHLGPKQLSTLEDAAKLLKHRLFWKNLPLRLCGRQVHTSVLSAHSAGISWKETLASPFWPDPVEHGGARDTSVALHLCPMHVSPQKELPLTQKRHPYRWVRNFKRRKKTLESYWGTPSLAHPQQGKQVCQEWMEKIFPKMMAVWLGIHTDREFRSWYSLFPVNRSFFKAWMLVFWICAFLAGMGLLKGATLFMPHRL